MTTFLILDILNFLEVLRLSNWQKKVLPFFITVNTNPVGFSDERVGHPAEDESQDREHGSVDEGEQDPYSEQDFIQLCGISKLKTKPNKKCDSHL